MKDVVILGSPISLQERSKAQMKGISIGDSLTYKFFKLCGGKKPFCFKHEASRNRNDCNIEKRS